MSIKKTIILFISLAVVFMISVLYSFQYIENIESKESMEKKDNYFHHVKISDKKIEKYKDNKWQEFNIKGIELSAFTPQNSNNQSKIKKELVIEWLELISDLNIEVIKIPSIQPPSFYAGIAEFNEDNDRPIYTIHQVNLDEKKIFKDHDIYSKGLINNLKKDIKNTIDVIHGRGLIVFNQRGNEGLFINNISNYNLGYIIGSNTSPEIVTLSNSKYPNKEDYNGKYYKINNGTAFESFVAEILDFTAKYEIDKYSQKSLLSYSTNIETNNLDYKHEPNRSKSAKVNLSRLENKKLNNIFIAYKYNPNDVDFLDYEYEEDSGENLDYTRDLKRLNDSYNLPIVISEVGMSSSRNSSRKELADGFSRGGLSEKEQGEKLVRLLKEINKVGVSGSIIKSWQDVWLNETIFNMPGDQKDLQASSYWHNVMASDENFGLIKFKEKRENPITIDNKFDDWRDKEEIISEDLKLKAYSDNNFLYLYVKNENENLDNSEVFVGLDITPISGSNYFAKSDAQLSIKADFVLDLEKADKAEVLVQSRYNQFEYLYKYYEHVVDKKIEIPAKNSAEFSKIKTLHRKKFFLKNSNKVIPAIYSEVGNLKKGSELKSDKEYSTLTDYNYKDNQLEVKIPWAMLNFINPLKSIVYDDFYKEGIEESILIKDIGLSLYDKSKDKTYAGKKRYKHKNKRSLDYDYKIKDSYYIVKDYLN